MTSLLRHTRLAPMPGVEVSMHVSSRKPEMVSITKVEERAIRAHAQRTGVVLSTDHWEKSGATFKRLSDRPTARSGWLADPLSSRRIANRRLNAVVPSVEAARDQLIVYKELMARGSLKDPSSLISYSLRLDARFKRTLSDLRAALTDRALSFVDPDRLGEIRRAYQGLLCELDPVAEFDCPTQGTREDKALEALRSTSLEISSLNDELLTPR